MLSGANVLEISDIQEERSRESVLKKRTLHRIENLPPYQFSSDRLGGASAVAFAPRPCGDCMAIRSCGCQEAAAGAAPTFFLLVTSSKPICQKYMSTNFMSGYRIPPTRSICLCSSRSSRRLSPEMQDPLNKCGVQVRVSKVGAPESVDEKPIASGQTPKSPKHNLRDERV
jgi:hypothetical protein